MAKNNNKKKFKNLWWLQLLFLFVFLGGGGFYAYVNMNKEAHKLVGGDKYADMNESESYNSEVSSSKENFFFSSEGSSSENKNSSNESSLTPSMRLEKKELDKASSRIAGIAGNNIDEDSETEGSMNEKASSARGHVSEGLDKRLAIKKGRVFSSKKRKGKTSGSFRANSKGEVLVKETEGTTAKKGKTVAKKKTSVMESLKKTWKMGIYGARDASKDAARGWIARAFDNTAPSRYSLEYEENVKRDLDRINPNSIPNYLKDMDVSKSSAKKLGIKDVGPSVLDVEATKKALAQDVQYQAAKMAQDVSGGMLNPMFSGMDFSEGSIGSYAIYDEDKKMDEPDDPGGMSFMSEPEDSPELFEDEMMDFGIEGCGEECGCTCDAPCCCLPPDYFNDVGDFPDPDTTTFWV